MVKILTVVAVLGLVACSIPPRDDAAVEPVGSLDDARQAQARSDLKTIRDACLLFKLDHGRLPTSLDELVTPDGSGLRYLAELPVDPWSKLPYGVTRTESGLEVWSLGQDQEEGGTGVDADLIAKV